MTISLVPEDSRLRRFTCVGGETVFAVTFPVFAAGDVQVLRLRAGVTVTLTNPGDYTLSGVGHPSGFTVTLTAPALAGDLIVVVSAQPVARTAEWTDGQALRAQALNAEFARWWIALQQIQRDVTRTVRLSLTDPSTGLELPAADVRAGKFLGFDGTGAAVAMGAPLGAVARSGDTMTGFLTLHADPIEAMHAVTKQYVDRRYSNVQTFVNASAIDFTEIPSWAKSVAMFVVLTSTSTSAPRVRLGDMNSFVTSNYVSRAISASTGVAATSATDCFIMSGQEIASSYFVNCEIVRQQASNVWLYTAVGNYGNPGFISGSGFLNVELVLSRVRLYVANGNMTGYCHVEWQR